MLPPPSSVLAQEIAARDPVDWPEGAAEPAVPLLPPALAVAEDMAAEGQVGGHCATLKAYRAVRAHVLGQLCASWRQG